MAILSYRNVQIHGGSPLVVDAKTRKLRFARVGKDRPEKCVSDPSELPDCEMTLHVFPSYAAERAWIEAAETDGADREILTGGGVNRVIEMRLDRPRRPGKTLNEVIPIVGPAPRPVQPPPAPKERVLEGLWTTKGTIEVTLSTVKRWAEANRPMIDALRAAGFEVDPRRNLKNAAFPEEGIINFSRGNRYFQRRLHGDFAFEDLRLERGRIDEVQLSPGYLARLKDQVREFCANSRRSCTFKPTATSPQEIAAEFARALDRIDRLVADAVRAQEMGSVAAELLADKRLLGLVDRAHAGCPPMLVDRCYREKAQVVPRTGNVQSGMSQVGNALRVALSRGIVEPCIVEDGLKIYGLTEVGRALAERDAAAVDAHFAANPPDDPQDAQAEYRRLLRVWPRRDPLAFSDPDRFAATREGIALALAAIEGEKTSGDYRESWYPLFRTAVLLGMADYDAAKGVVLTEPDAAPRPAR